MTANSMRISSDFDKADFAASYIDGLIDVLRRLDRDCIARAVEVLERAWETDARIFIAGNGGSAATASHMANDLAKTVAGKRLEQPGFAAISLTDNVPLMTALANDIGYDEVFSGQMFSLAKEGDVLVVISGSGNSANLLRAAEVAREMGLRTVGFLGMGGGRLRDMVDIAVVVPSDDYGPIEDVHMMLDHLITAFFYQAIRKGALRRPGSAEPH